MSNNLNQGASEAELLPCAHCGASGKVKRGKTVMVSCTKCGSSTFQLLDDKNSAIAAWNRRTPAATTGAAPSVKTWQERLQDHADCRPGEAERRSMKAEIADLRAQLAAKGQGYAVEVKPGEKCPCGQTRDWCIANECKDAAPASAQPANLESEIQYLKNVAADAVPMLSHDWPKTSLLLKDAVEKVDAASKAGAQPDQRESAAEAIRNEALEVAALLCETVASDKYDQYKGRGKYAPNNPHRADVYTSGESDGADLCADKIRALKSDAAAPAAQPTQKEAKNDAL